jgi:hypothetical protein
MIDRLFFLFSRGFGPLNNLATLFVVGFAFGKGSIGDYTYALAICSPIYFIITFSLPTYIAIQRPGTANRPEVLWTRIGTLVLSLIPAVIATFAADPKISISGALWILKAGDVLFDPVIVFSVTDGSSTSRGRRMVRMESIRLLAVQSMLWLSAFVLHANLPMALATAGIANALISGYFLLNVPRWSSLRCSLKAIWQRAGSIAAASAPMAMSGVLLAIIIGLPRLLLDTSLTPDERMIVGLAQVAGSVFALLFNAGWMYELDNLKTTVEVGDFRRLFRQNARLSLSYLALLSLASLSLLAVPGAMLLKVHITKQHAGLLAFVVFTLGLPHCFSVHRDVLKLVERTWLEVRILLAALLSGVSVWYLCAHLFGWGWTTVMVAMVVAMTMVQGFAATLVLSKAIEQVLLERRRGDR